MLSKDIFVPLTISIDQTRRALVIVLPCYGALEIVGVIIIIIIKRTKNKAGDYDDADAVSCSYKFRVKTGLLMAPSIPGPILARGGSAVYSKQTDWQGLRRLHYQMTRDRLTEILQHVQLFWK